ncbi:MAG: hypothetical protein AB7F65_05650 [Dehalococcoidia bacterium]
MNGFSSGGSDLPSASLVGAAQHAAIAVSSAWNACYFALRLLRPGTRGRRLAAAVLALLFIALSVEALAGLPVAATSAEVARRTPLLLATTGVAILVSYRGGVR